MPNIMRWLARIQSRQVSDVPVITQDWTVTILDVAEARHAPDFPLDGLSLAPYLLGGASGPQHDLFWRTKSARALRRGKWKFLRQGTALDGLYDLSADPRENANLIQRQPDIAAQLSARWDEINKDLLPYP